MALTEIKTSGIADDAVTTDKLANAINTARDANTAKASITINNNGNKKVIIGTSTANTLEADSNLFVANGKLSIGNVVPSGQISNNSLDVKGDETNAYIDLGDPFPTFSSGQFPTARLKTVDANKTLELQSMYGGDNQLYKHIELSGHNTIFYEGNNNNTEIARVTTDGLTFNGDTAAANALDDYEEGTWTPKMKKYSNNSWVDATMTDNGTVQVARYVKVGKVCTIYLHWDGWQQSDANYAVIGDLPFAAHSSGGGHGTVNYTDAFTNNQNQGIYVSNNTTIMQFYHSSNAWNGWSSSSNRNIHCGITYQTV